MKSLRMFGGIVLGVMMLSTAFVGIASAQQYPTVSNLTPFSAQTDYMSLPGYLRYVSYQQSQQWLTYTEATRIVKQQKGG